MTPGARVAAAIEVLDGVLAGRPAEQVLTNWARSSRYAGSGDRAAVRDHVFDALRCKRSFAARGGAETGRGLMLGALRQQGMDISAVFNGQGHAPAPLSDAEAAFVAPPMSDAERLDCPDWLWPQLSASLGPNLEPVLTLLQSRSPLFLRVNLRRSTREDAQHLLAEGGIECRPHHLSPTALEVVTNPRRVQSSAAYRDGLVEIQDAASQAIVDLVPLMDGARVLDYCAGGGGKSLAMAARADVQITAYDVNPHRMNDLPARSIRADVNIKIATERSDIAGQYDIVFCDAPCSGSGAWRRSPQGKWALSADGLNALLGVQAKIMDEAVGFLAPKGVLTYATCSLLDAENSAQIQAFIARHRDFTLSREQRLSPMDGGDGFFIALLTRI